MYRLLRQLYLCEESCASASTALQRQSVLSVKMQCIPLIIIGWSAKAWIERYKFVAFCSRSLDSSLYGCVFPYRLQSASKCFDQVTLIATALLFPVILIHGYTDVPILTGSWRSTEWFLSGKGVEYFTPQIPPHGSIDERSKSLIDQIATRYPGRTVHLFGHSMVGRPLLHSFRHPHATFRGELMLEISLLGLT